MLNYFKSLTPKQVTFYLVSIITALNLFSAGLLGLSTDEAHYALYAVHLDWSYYDHPPLVGWLQAAMLYIGHTDMLLRLWPIIFNILSAIALYHYVRLLFANKTEWVACLSVAFMQSAIILHILSIALLPQVPFIFFSILAMRQLYKIVNQPRVTLTEFLVFGLLLGFAALSEYTAILLVVVTIVFMVTSTPRLFKNYRLWLAALVALVCCFPVIFWNIQQQWSSLIYQQQHIMHNEHWSLLTLLQSQLGQCFTYTPLVYICGVILLVRYWRQWSNLPIRLSLIIAWTWLVFFIDSGGYTFTLPHWTAVGWILTFPLVADYLVQHWQKKWIRVLTVINFFYAFILLSFMYTQTFFHWLNLPLGQDPFRDLYGWRQAAMEARQELTAIPVIVGEAPPRLYVPNWSLASRLAWYSGLPVQVADAQDRSQFYYWYGVPQQHAYGILVVPFGSDAPALQSNKAGQFGHCTLQKKLSYFKSGMIVNTFTFYYCWDYHM